MSYCCQEQLVYGTANAEHPREAFGLFSVNTGWQLEQKVEPQNELRSGLTVPAVLYSEGRETEREREGKEGTEGNGGIDLEQPLLAQYIMCISAEIKNETMQGGKQR